MRQRLLSAVKICPRYIVKRHFTSSSAQCQSNQAERYAEMLAYLKQRTSNLSTNLSAKRSALETRFSALSQEISRVSGYTDIEALKNEVHEHETMLQTARTAASKAKEAYGHAVVTRAASQRETNDLLSRKNNWSTNDVSRFTELVREDHLNEQAERDRKAELDQAEERVDRVFTLLMRAILARYHEEQVWSDKIRSLSTYGSLAITGANVLIFLLAIIIVEPWRRRRLIERLEKKMVIREEHILDKTDESLSLVLQKLDGLQTDFAALSDSPAATHRVAQSTPATGADETLSHGETVEGSSATTQAPEEEGSLRALYAKYAALAKNYRIDEPTALTTLAGFVIGVTCAAIGAGAGR